MERINLSQAERIAIHTLASGNYDEKFLTDFSGAIHTLEARGLVRAQWLEGHTAVDAALTSQGQFYLSENPKLRGKTNWAAIGAIAGIAAAISGLIAAICAGMGLLIACSKIL